MEPNNQLIERIKNALRAKNWDEEDRSCQGEFGMLQYRREYGDWVGWNPYDNSTQGHFVDLNKVLKILESDLPFSEKCYAITRF